MQLDLFKDQKPTYKEYYAWFYRGVKQRYKRESLSRFRKDNEIISINIIPKVGSNT